MPVPQRVNFIVEQAGKPVLEKGARCEYEPTFAEVAKLTLKRAYGNSELFNSSLY